MKNNDKAHIIIPLLKALKQGGATLTEKTRNRFNRYCQDNEHNYYYFKEHSLHEESKPNIPNDESPKSTWIDFIVSNPDGLMYYSEVPTSRRANRLNHSADPWDNYCRNYSNKAFDVLKTIYEDCEEKDKWPVGRWKFALSSWESEYLKRNVKSEEDHKKKFNLDFYSLFSFLNTVPEKRYRDVIEYSLSLLKSCTSIFVNLDDEYEVLFNEFFSRNLILIESKCPNLDTTSSSAKTEHFIEAKRTLAGTFAEIVLKYQFIKSPKHNDGIQDNLKKIFEKLSDRTISAFSPGRCVIARFSIDLFLYDADWTKDYLLPQFSWEENPDAAGIWQGYLWGTRWTPDFLSKIHADFLETSKKLNQLDESSENYVHLITYLSLKKEPVFLKKEYKDSISNFDSKSLTVCLSAVETFFNAASDPEELWKSTIKPFFESIWPQDKDIFSDSMTCHFLDIILLSGKAFPDAVNTLSPWLKLGSNDANYSVVYLFEELLLSDQSQTTSEAYSSDINGNSFIKTEPKASLKLLAALKLTSSDLTKKDLLSKCLKSFKEAKLHQTPEYIILERLLD